MQIYRDEFLIHYGVKGMKWGVRRYQNYDGTLTELGKQRLTHQPGRIRSTLNAKFKKGYTAYGGIKVNKLSKHALEQTQDPTRDVTAPEILDALSKPLNHDNMPIRYNKNGQPSYRYIGEHATVNLNPDTGVVTTCWKTGHKEIKKYKKE